MATRHFRHELNLVTSEPSLAAPRDAGRLAMAMALAYERFTEEIAAAEGERAALKKVRRRIRAHPTLDDDERAELLEQARYVPGCLPPPSVLDDDGNVRSATCEEITAKPERPPTRRDR